MSKQCQNCGAELPEEASFCPHCAHSQIEKTQTKPPRLWRKKALYAAVGIVVVIAAALAVILPHRPKTYEGGSFVSYTDKDGIYELFISTSEDDINIHQPEEKRTVSLAEDENSGVEALVGVFRNGAVADPEQFLSKVESCTLEVYPDENGTFDTEKPSYKEQCAPALFESDVYFTGSSGTNELRWTLTMKNGDTVRLSQVLDIVPLVRQSFTAEDAAMETVEDLNALLERIDAEVPADTVVDIYLPAVTYTGEIHISSRAVNLYGCSDGSGRTVIEGSLYVESDNPDVVRIQNIDFTGSGGSGLVAMASSDIRDCSFTGYDIGASVKDGGMIGVETCTFRGNGTAFSYDTTMYSFFRTDFSDCTIEDNETGIRFVTLPGSDPLNFAGTVFRNNGTDIENPISYPIDTSDAVFE